MSMVFEANSGQAPSSGEWFWVQLVNSNQEEEVESDCSWDYPAQPQSQSGLDTSYPYTEGVSNVNDIPHSPMSGYGECQRSFQATMYLMGFPATVIHSCAFTVRVMGILWLCDKYAFTTEQWYDVDPAVRLSRAINSAIVGLPLVDTIIAID